MIVETCQDNYDDEVSVTPYVRNPRKLVTLDLKMKELPQDYELEPEVKPK
jgi:hypothetical protein